MPIIFTRINFFTDIRKQTKVLKMFICKYLWVFLSVDIQGGWVLICKYKKFHVWGGKVHRTNKDTWREINTRNRINIAIPYNFER